MSYIQRELDALGAALREGGNNQAELYAAQQALSWALDPMGYKSPLSMLTDIQADSIGCLAECGQPSS